MKHNLPPEVQSLLAEWDNLGFERKLEAAEFILANPEWNKLVKRVKFKEAEIAIVNEWRKLMVSNEVARRTTVPSFNGTPFHYSNRGGKVNLKNYANED